MKKNDIKKALYKEKPIAKRYAKTMSNSYYHTRLQSGQDVYFTIPNDEMGQVPFDVQENAQLLSRWLGNYESII